MSERKYHLSDVESHFASIIDVIKSGEAQGISAIDLIKANHCLWCWVFAHGSQFVNKLLMPDKKDISLVEPFWSICAEYGFNLTQEQKQEIFEDFIND